jgi:hypothetical protein
MPVDMAVEYSEARSYRLNSGRNGIMEYFEN